MDAYKLVVPHGNYPVALNAPATTSGNVLQHTPNYTNAILPRVPQVHTHASIYRGITKS